MNRNDLQSLADLYVDEAKTLLDAGKAHAAYYLSGYAVECALKASIAKLTNLHDYPDKQFAQRCYTHNVMALVEVAGLNDALKADRDQNAVLNANWAIVKDWKESSRYRLTTTLNDAVALYNAIADPANGVLEWIKTRW